MSRTEFRMPGFWRFVWLFFMQPITLHRLLRSVQVDPDESAWKLLRRSRTSHETWWLTRSALVLLLITPTAAFVAAGVVALSGVRISWLGVFVGAAVGVATGVASCMAIDVAFGVAFGIAFGVAVGVVGGMAPGVVTGVGAEVVGGVAVRVVIGAAAGIVFGAAFGVVVGVAVGVTRGVAVGVGDGVRGSVAVGVTLGVSVGVLLTGVPVGVAFGVAAGIALLLSVLGLPVFVFEVFTQIAAWSWRAATGQTSLQWAPVLYHELSYLPHPFLRSHMVAEAAANPDVVRRVLDACSIAPGQRRTGRIVEATLRARELKALAGAQAFRDIAELRGSWLPGVEGADRILLAFSEAGRFAAAAEAAFNPYHRLKHFAGLANQLTAIENQLRGKRNAFTQPFEEPLQAFRDVERPMRAEAEKAAAGLIPNPFRAGNPLSGEEGPELFRGRDAAVREIEEIFADASRTASLQLLAPRRAGKTSLLKMLPHMLPDTVCVFFDLQAHPVSSVAAFWNKLAEQAIVQAKLGRQVELPKLPVGPPMEAAATWLEQLDRLPNGRRVLLAIDEFERLEDLFPGSRQEFLQLMGLFRATIQHRRGVRLLVSGAAPFDELDRVWDDHFISARQIKLPFLDSPTSVGLLTAPSPDFPPGTIPEEVAREVYRRTGGQPFLLQVYGSLLVSRLNDEKGKEATFDDVTAVEGRAIEWAEAYFRDTFKSAPEAAREALGQLAQGETVALAPATRRWLSQRYLLTADDRLAIPVLGAWIEHHALA